MTNVEAAQKAVDVLRTAGKLGDAESGLVMAVLSLARAVDELPTRATLWREYREALADLREVTSDVDDGSLAALLAELSSTDSDPAAS